MAAILHVALNVALNAAFVFWVVALVTTLLNLWLLPRLRAVAPAADGPLVSILIPARNEERAIGRTVRAMLAQTYRNLEVIVLDDRSTDATGVILAEIAREDPRLVPIHGDDPPPGWLGKPWALAQASRRARGELLVFVDADIDYALEAVAAAVDHIERTGVDMIALMPRFVLHGLAEHAAMPILPLTVLSFIPTWLGNRTRLPSLGIGGGPGNLIRRSAYDRAGGHDALCDAVIDDVGMARLVRRSGGRTEAVLADQYVSLRMYHGLGEIVDGFTKNAFSVFGRNYLTMLISLVMFVAMHLLPYVAIFIPHVRMRALGCVALITLVRILVFRPFRYPLWNALLLHPLLTLIWAWIFLRSLWFTGIRRQLLWRGRTYDARSTRFGAER